MGGVEINPITPIDSRSVNFIFFRQIGVGHQAISLLWTARAVGCSSGYALTGTTFGSSWMDSSRRRLMFLGFGLFIVTICLFAIPFINTFMLMISGESTNIIKSF